MVLRKAKSEEIEWKDGIGSETVQGAQLNFYPPLRMCVFRICVVRMCVVLADNYEYDTVITINRSFYSV